MNPGIASQPRSGFRSAFDHATEVAEADYYKVRLDDYNIIAELTTTTRVGYHRYTFPASGQAHIILDLVSGIYNYEDKNVWTYVRVENDTLVTGYRETSGWGRTRTVYFALAFSKPFIQYGTRNFSKRQVYHGFWGNWDQAHNFPEAAGRQLRMHFDFHTTEGTQILLKFALSSVSAEGALLNLRTEAPGWDFDAVRRQGQAAWNAELNKVQIQATEDEKVNFYTSVYHAFINPTVYMDVDGSYKGIDQLIHKADGFTNYTTFSLWDTHRALHPLFNILQPHRNADMIRSMLAHYDQSPEHMLPVWSFIPTKTGACPGITAWPCLPTPSSKATPLSTPTAHWTPVSLPPATATSKASAPISTRAISHPKSAGFPFLRPWNMHMTTGASPRQQRNWAEWTSMTNISNGRKNYRNVFDPSIGYMRPRLSDGSFRQAFDVLSTDGQGFIEGNAWNYTLYVPHDPDGLIALMGGKKRFVQRLDSLFTMTLPDKFFAETEDITRDGIIGGYVHGNEPSHHVAYLYDWTDQPWKTQERVRMILGNQYHSSPDGLGGNDDTGQMSAWYIFTALGSIPSLPVPTGTHWAAPPSMPRRSRWRMDMSLRSGRSTKALKMFMCQGSP